MRRLFSEAMWVVAGQGFGLLGTFTALKLTVLWLGVAEYGWFALGLGAMAAFGIALFGPLNQVGLRFFSAWRERGLLQVMRAELTVGASCIVAAGFSFIFIVAVAIWTLRGAQWVPLIIASGIGGIASGLNVTFGAILTAARRRSEAAFLAGGEPWIRLGVAAIMGATAGWTATNLLLGYAVGAALLSIFACHRALGLMKSEAIPELVDQLEFRRSAVHYALPFVAFGICAALVQMDRWIIELVLNVEDVGRYAAILQLASAPSALLVTALGLIVMPLLFDDHEKGRGHEHARVLMFRSVLVYIGMCVPVLVVFVLFDEDIVRVLTSENIASQSGLLWVMFLAMALFQAGQFLVTEGLRLMRPHKYILAKVIHAAILFVSCWALTNTHGLRGAAWALVLSSVIYLVIVMLANENARRVSSAAI